MTALLTLEEIKAHLRVDHDADDDMLMDKVRQATAVLLAYIQGSRDKVIREDGELIPGEALTRMKGAAMRLSRARRAVQDESLVVYGFVDSFQLRRIGDDG